MNFIHNKIPIFFFQKRQIYKQNEIIGKCIIEKTNHNSLPIIGYKVVCHLDYTNKPKFKSNNSFVQFMRISELCTFTSIPSEYVLVLGRTI